jgi:CO/xanthine dehydrogenase Mo-binding subunit
MTTRWFGARVPRLEDPRLLTGRALFVDDVDLPGMLHVAFVRSPLAHARIAGVYTAAAAARPGVVRVITAADLGAAFTRGPVLVPPPATLRDAVFHARTAWPLARDRVRHVGEAIAMVVAESRYLAEDAAEEVLVDLEPLPVVHDLERALDADAPLVHDDLESNVAAHVVQTKGDYAHAAAAADLLVRSDPPPRKATRRRSSTARPLRHRCRRPFRQGPAASRSSR